LSFAEYNFVFVKKAESETHFFRWLTANKPGKSDLIILKYYNVVHYFLNDAHQYSIFTVILNIRCKGGGDLVKGNKTVVS
jgi:hypothetical protein